MSELSRAPAVEPPVEPVGGALGARFARVRGATAALAARLSPEDQLVQSMPDASPTKWHLAHTSWFFETFALAPFLKWYAPFDPAFAYLYNSYYEAEGPRHCRSKRGLLSRPSVGEVARYRSRVDEGVLQLLSRGAPPAELAARIELGLHHEQQHQELLLTDILHLFAQNPLRPAYRPSRPSRVGHAGRAGGPAPAGGFARFDEGLRRVGHEGPGFAFDNEGPRHRVFVPAFELALGPVTSGEYLAFMADRGYERPELWLSEGFARARAAGLRAPLYWEPRGSDGWVTMTLDGMAPVHPDEPACHLGFFEADAYARWKGARLPTEAEWELAAESAPLSGNFVESEALRPLAASEPPATAGPRQLFGDVWEWTASPYLPYPGFRTPEGALGEYNAKFMCNQFVLRGGSCVTPGDHIRATYRNFFPPEARWQFSGLRLCRDATSGARG